MIVKIIEDIIGSKYFTHSDELERHGVLKKIYECDTINFITGAVEIYKDTKMIGLEFKDFHIYNNREQTLYLGRQYKTINR